MARFDPPGAARAVDKAAVNVRCPAPALRFVPRVVAPLLPGATLTLTRGPAPNTAGSLCQPPALTTGHPEAGTQWHPSSPHLEVGWQRQPAVLEELRHRRIQVRQAHQPHTRADTHSHRASRAADQHHAVTCLSSADRQDPNLHQHHQDHRHRIPDQYRQDWPHRRAWCRQRRQDDYRRWISPCRCQPFGSRNSSSREPRRETGRSTSATELEKGRQRGCAVTRSGGASSRTGGCRAPP